MDMMWQLAVRVKRGVGAWCPTRRVGSSREACDESIHFDDSGGLGRAMRGLRGSVTGSADDSSHPSGGAPGASQDAWARLVVGFTATFGEE